MNIQSSNNFQSLIKKDIQNLFPSYFALVMATGIVSIALYIFKIPFLDEILFYINVFAYTLLWILLINRIIFYFNDFKNDYLDHAKSPGFLSIVAATNIVGSQFVIIYDNFQIANYFYCFGILLWLIQIYSFFLIITIKKEKPSLSEGINGIWLLVIVSTQSISVLGTLIAKNLDSNKEIVLFLSLVLFLIGCFFYLVIITLIFYRLSFFEIKPEQFAPAYWINTGAVAITTLAGSLLILNSNQWQLLVDLKEFLTGLTLLFWGVSTWWIPLIFLLGMWRHFKKFIPFTYHPQYWGMVFPLGMYSVCTFRLAQVLNLTFLNTISSIFVYVSLIAWLITFSGLSINKINLYLIKKQTNE